MISTINSTGNRSAGSHGQISLPLLVIAIGWLVSSAGDPPAAFAQPPTPAPLPRVGETRTAHDSLADDVDQRPDAAQCLAGLRWKSAEFSVEVRSPDAGRGDRLLVFPSPHPQGNAVHDGVVMEWYAAKDERGHSLWAPAVVVVHESGRSMPVGRLIARGLAGMGLHAFMIQLPGYGNRRSELTDRPELILTSLRQGIADVRRAYDAVAVWPSVDSDRIGVQGTSLGGFVTATVVGLDSAFDRAFILLAGGNLDQVVLNGKKDAAKIRQNLNSLGISDDQIRDLARPIEPLRLAHRIAPEKTWLYSGMFDDVVPRESSYALAKAARLPADHHVEWPANHYSGIIFLPIVLQQITDELKRADPAR